MAPEERRKSASVRKVRVDVGRLRRQVSFDRLLAQIVFENYASPWEANGDDALELLIKSTRSIADMDLCWHQTLQRRNLATQSDHRYAQCGAEVDLKDWFEFSIGAPIMDLTAAPYGGARYPVEARMAGRTFPRFRVDVGLGDVIIRPAETIECRDWLAFAGIERHERASLDSRTAVCREAWRHIPFRVAI